MCLPSSGPSTLEGPDVTDPWPQWIRRPGRPAPVPVSGGAWGWLWAFVGVHADLGTQGSGLARFGREEGRDLTCLGPL